MKKRSEAQLSFLLEIDKLKQVQRQNRLSDDSRKENTAEHSWHLVMFALVFSEYLEDSSSDKKGDLSRALLLCAIHDIVEIDAGDTFLWDAKGYEDKRERECRAADRLFGLLPEDQALYFREAWEEFEDCKTPESLFANAVDKLAPVLMNVNSGGTSWKEHKIKLAQVQEKMTVVAKASPELGIILENLIQSALVKGFLIN